MTFLNPFFLIALSALALPVIVHLLNLRKASTIKFSTLRFFEELVDKTVRRIKIKEYILLVLRALALLMLALALARPIMNTALEGGLNNSAKRHVIFLDNSPSMEQLEEGGPFMDQAIQLAEMIVSESKSTDVFRILPTHSSQNLSSDATAEQAMNQLGRIAVQNTGNRLEDQMQQQFKLLEQAGSYTNIFYLISDGQASAVQQLQSFLEKNNKPYPINLFTVGARPDNNTGITSISVENQLLAVGRPVRVSVELTNFGTADLVNAFVSLKKQDEIVGQYPVDLEAGSKGNFVFEVIANKAGTLNLSAVLEGDRWLFDNTRYLPLSIPDQKTILRITESGLAADEASYFDLALKASTGTTTEFGVKTLKLDDLRLGLLDSASVVILERIESLQALPTEALISAVQQGTGLIIIPTERSSKEEYNRLFQSMALGRYQDPRGDFATYETLEALSRPADGHPIFENLFERKENEEIRLRWPDLYYLWPYRAAGTQSLAIFQSASGEGIFTEESLGLGKVLVSSIGTGPGWSNFPANSFFPAFWYQVIQYYSAGNESSFSQFTVGDRVRLLVDAKEDDFRVETEQGTLQPDIDQTLQGQWLGFDTFSLEPGFITISSNLTSRTIAIQPDTSESSFELISQDEEGRLRDIGIIWKNLGAESQVRTAEILSSVNTGKEIWNWFVILGLLFLMAESLVGRLYRAENVS